ncbi:hypothetical protein AMK22_35155 [Streptomyces sp. CB01580]|nr:hypothetical protein AMK22_35155 [Streptomyces sp. CB01580]
MAVAEVPQVQGADADEPLGPGGVLRTGIQVFGDDRHDCDGGGSGRVGVLLYPAYLIAEVAQPPLHPGRVSEMPGDVGAQFGCQPLDQQQRALAQRAVLPPALRCRRQFAVQLPVGRRRCVRALGAPGGFIEGRRPDQGQRERAGRELGDPGFGGVGAGKGVALVAVTPSRVMVSRSGRRDRPPGLRCAGARSAPCIRPLPAHAECIEVRAELLDDVLAVAAELRTGRRLISRASSRV